jgi:hypothetical protein
LFRHGKSRKNRERIRKNQISRAFLAMDKSAEPLSTDGETQD